MRTRMMVIALVLALVAVGAVTADDTAPLGRDVARDGQLSTVSGTLAYRSEEWFLDAQRESYELHMGPYGHDESLPFISGAEAVVRGFVVPNHIAPITVATSGETHRFWNEGRYPLWAGSGALRNSVTENGGERLGIENGRGLAFGRLSDDERLGRAAEANAIADAPQTDDGPGRRVAAETEPRFRNRDLRPGQGR